MKRATVGETIADLSARRTSLATTSAVLREAEHSLSQSLSHDWTQLPQGSRLRDLLVWQSVRTRHLQTARTILREAERLLAEDLKGVRQAAAMIERELGKRRPPGRPPALTPMELRLARVEREAGQSWEQVRRTLNNMRHVEGKDVRPPLSLATLRTAVSPRPPAKKPSASSPKR